MKYLLDSQLFPCLDYFKILVENRDVAFYRYERFKKMSFQNRYIIGGANGLIRLSIPVVGGREQKATLTAVEVDDTIDWRTRHWRSITSTYRSAPFFEYYQELIHRLVFAKQKNLFELNYSILVSLCKLLEINVVVDFLESDSSGCGTEDYRNRFVPRTFQDGKENWTPKYYQIFQDRQGFQPNLSILDLLFCEGPGAPLLLRNSIRG